MTPPQSQPLLTNRVREFKKRYHLTAQAVSSMTGINVGTIEALTRRRRHVPTPENLLALATLFQLESPLDLLEWVGPSPVTPLGSPSDTLKTSLNPLGTSHE